MPRYGWGLRAIELWVARLQVVGLQAVGLQAVRLQVVRLQKIGLPKPEAAARRSVGATRHQCGGSAGAAREGVFPNQRALEGVFRWE